MNTDAIREARCPPPGWTKRGHRWRSQFPLEIHPPHRYLLNRTKEPSSSGQVSPSGGPRSPAMRITAAVGKNSRAVGRLGCFVAVSFPRFKPRSSSDPPRCQCDSISTDPFRPRARNREPSSDQVFSSPSELNMRRQEKQDRECAPSKGDGEGPLVRIAARTFFLRQWPHQKKVGHRVGRGARERSRIQRCDGRNDKRKKKTKEVTCELKKETMETD